MHHVAMVRYAKVTVVTVAGTVYESHVLPYSPAFKPAPAIYERTLESNYTHSSKEIKGPPGIIISEGVGNISTRDRQAIRDEKS